jgi:ABC-2 type transport system permease protein
MTAIITSEYRKLWTVRWPRVLLIVQVGLFCAGSIGMMVAKHRDPVDIQLVMSFVGVTSLFSYILGVMAVAGEYRDGTIAATFLDAPRRARVIVAKLVAYMSVAFAFAVLTSAVALCLAGVWAALRNAPVDLASAVVWQTLAGAVLWYVLFAGIGVAIGALLPNLAWALALGLVWIGIAEGIAANVLGSDVARWLPVAAGEGLEKAPGLKLLPPVEAALVLVLYAVVLAAVATAATVRRDVG